MYRCIGADQRMVISNNDMAFSERPIENGCRPWRISATVGSDGSKIPARRKDEITIRHVNRLGQPVQCQRSSHICLGDDRSCIVQSNKWYRRNNACRNNTCRHRNSGRVSTGGIEIAPIGDKVFDRRQAFRTKLREDPIDKGFLNSRQNEHRNIRQGAILDVSLGHCNNGSGVDAQVR